MNINIRKHMMFLAPHVRRGIAFLLLLAFVSLSVSALGCATNPPKKERAAAELAFKSAKPAEKCAAVRFEQARKALEKARALLTEKKFDESKTYFNIARALSEKALSEAMANKECMEPPTAKGEAPPEEETDEASAAVPEDAGDPALRDPNYELPRIFFPFNSDEITPEAREILAGTAGWMNHFTDVTVRVEGHCDERGSTEYNLALGERRARAVTRYLEDLNVNPDHLTVISFGEEKPLDETSGEEAWQRNRRAEFVKVWR